MQCLCARNYVLRCRRRGHSHSKRAGYIALILIVGVGATKVITEVNQPIGVVIDAITTCISRIVLEAAVKAVRNVYIKSICFGLSKIVRQVSITISPSAPRVSNFNGVSVTTERVYCKINNLTVKITQRKQNIVRVVVNEVAVKRSEFCLSQVGKGRPARCF